MSSVTLLERLAPGGRVDRQAGVVHGVKIIGLISKNGRRYSESALRNAIKFYEGIVVNIDHPQRGTGGVDRSYRDRFGQLQNVRFSKDGLYGDLFYNPKHPLAEQFAWDAENRPNVLGLSHNAQGQVTRRDGIDVVEEITNVRSVDIVADPASTGGLYESRGKNTSGGELMPSSLEEFVTYITGGTIATPERTRRFVEAITSDGLAATPPTELAPARRAPADNLADQVALLRKMLDALAKKVAALAGDSAPAEARESLREVRRGIGRLNTLVERLGARRTKSASWPRDLDEFVRSIT